MLPVLIPNLCNVSLFKSILKIVAVHQKRFSKTKTFNFTSGSEDRYASPCQISSKSVERLHRYGDLTVFKMAAVCHLWFLKLKCLTVGTLKRPILQHRTKFREDRSNRCGGIAIFVILKIWPRPVLHVQKFESLTAVCGQNASSC